MPIDYKNYDPAWKTEIRPAILKRARNCCENCGVKNYSVIKNAMFRMTYEFEAYKDARAFADKLNNGEKINRAIVVVLTISHTNHDINDNREENLKALCQRCHNRHDIDYRKKQTQ